MSFPTYPEYRNTEIQWLGEIPSHWSICALKRGFQILGGTTPSTDDVNWNGPIQWATPADLSGLSSLYLHSTKRTLSRNGMASCGCSMLPVGSIILSTRAPIGSLAINTEPMTTNQGCKGLVPGDDTDSAFFAYVLSISKALLNNLGKGTTFLELSGDELGRFQLMFPPVLEQTQIARFLDHETAKIDALIREQERLIELLQEKRQAVISHAVTKGLDPDVPMKDSGVEWLGAVPEHWEIRKLSTITDKITNGYVGPTRGLFVDDGVRYLQSLHIKNNEIRFNQPYFVQPEWSEQHSKSILREGDVLVVQTGDIGQSAVVTKEFSGSNCHALIVVSPVRKVLNGTYLSWVLNSPYGKHTLLSIQTGALHPHLNCGYVKDVWIPLPPVDEQRRIIEYLQAELASFQSLANEASAVAKILEERRSALISAAVTGKIDVRKWQPPADESAFDKEVRQAGIEATA